MDARLTELLQLFDLEQLEINLFRGLSRDIGSPQVYGGQVLGQALRAACATVEAQRLPHSLHAYFLLRGDPGAPIVYDVERSRDGHSFSNRRVSAIQHGQQIFHMAASFQVPQSGVEHQLPMPEVPTPMPLPDADGLLDLRPERLPANMRRGFARHTAFEFRLVAPQVPDQSPGNLPRHRIWLRTVDRLPDDETLHRSVLAYMSDAYLLHTATLPHSTAFSAPAPQPGTPAAARSFIASIDHAMWFHRPVRVDEWFLYVTDSPSASGSRGFTRGSIYARDGRLGASTAQEGLLRIG